MRNCRMSSSWFLILLFLSCIFINSLEASHEKKLPSAVVVGTVYCDTCFQNDFSKASHFISGATVAVECGHESSKPTFREEAKTDGNGEFKVDLPTSVSKHVKKIKGCSVKLISSSQPYCAVASTATSSSNSLHLKSRSKQGTHIFSAGFFTFKPLKQPNLCYQKPSVQNSKKYGSMKFLLPPTNNPPTFLPSPVQNPTMPGLPMFPTLPPLPQLPPQPSLPGLPDLPPFPGKTTNSKPTESSNTTPLLNQKTGPFFFPPTIFPSPPPAIGGVPLPPNPLQPPSILPPNPFQPTPPFPNLPPIPGLSPPPTPPAFPFPFPPFPFPLPPAPRFPGIPPASSSSTNKASP